MKIRRLLFAAAAASLMAVSAGCGNEDVVPTADTSKLEIVESTKPTEETEPTTEATSAKTTAVVTKMTGTATTTAVRTTAAGRVVASGGNKTTQKSQNSSSTQNRNTQNNRNNTQNSNANQNSSQRSNQSSGGQGQPATVQPTNGNVTPTEAPTQAPTDPPQEPVSYDFSQFQSYQDWAKDTGYASGALVPGGSDGINQDYYHTLAGAQNYTSGNIVVGDSRCCQMGIYEQRNGGTDFAAFGVWGGHFTNTAPPVLSSQLLADVEECFKAQIDACGKCDLYFFSSVNDYDFATNNNADNISAAIQAAETLANLTYDNGSGVYHPNVYIIGFDGCWTTSDLWGTPQEDFNRYVDDYNEAVRAAISESPILSVNAGSYTTVPEIAGGKAGFIDDGLHYSDETISAIASHIAS